MATFGTATPDATTRAVIRPDHLATWKTRGERWSMLTAYDYSTARILDSARIPVLLVGDSAANVVYGYDTTVPIGYDTTVPIGVDELVPLVGAVVRGAPHALVVADLPFGAYESGADAARASAVRFVEQTGARAVKLEGGLRVASHIAAITAAGIPVMAHIGFTPQSVNGLGGYRVQGRGAGADALIADALAVQEAGAFAVVLEMVPTDVAAEITGTLAIPTIGIGAGPQTDAQLLVWQDMAGFNRGHTARFVKRFGHLGDDLVEAARAYAEQVRSGAYPAPEHRYA